MLLLVGGVLLRMGRGCDTHAEVVLWLEGSVFGWFGGFPVEGWEGCDWGVGILFFFCDFIFGDGIG